jgi:ribosomal protein S18 acetylase RimI-like enzyme
MKIRIGNENDIVSMVELDRECFGEYGAKKDYFIKKLNSPSGNIIVAYDDGEMVGFVVFEILEKDVIPEDFSNLKINFPIKGKWVHMVAFTTRGKYKDKEVDSEILLSAEKFAKKQGCVESYVPLSKYHPFKDNGVFEFWKKNGYENVGEIKWKAGPNELIECFFYRKSL